MVGDILQPTHLLFVLIVALLVLGPKRLPEVGRQLGDGIRDFRAAINGERNEHESYSGPGHVEDYRGTTDPLSPGHQPNPDPPLAFTSEEDSEAPGEPAGGAGGAPIIEPPAANGREPDDDSAEATVDHVAPSSVPTQADRLD